MRDATIIDAAQAFLALMSAEAPPSLETLAARLDTIAAASHTMPYGKPSKHSRRVRFPIARSRGPTLASRFPAERHYVGVEALGEIHQAPYYRDAIDDLADIATVMEEAVWRADHCGPDDAYWFLRTQQFHWEWHLRELSHYIFSRRFLDFGR